MEGKIHVGNSQMCVTEHGIELAETSTSSPGRPKLRLRHQAANVVHVRYQQCWWRERLHMKKATMAIQIWRRTVVQTKAANKVKRQWKRKTWQKSHNFYSSWGVMNKKCNASSECSLDFKKTAVPNQRKLWFLFPSNHIWSALHILSAHPDQCCLFTCGD